MPHILVCAHEGRFLSPEGRCHAFDERADGYARGEAIACLILKPLAAALCDGDTIRGIIRGTGSNQDGRTPGITLPSGTAQEALIRDVYARAGLCPSETEVVEAHGTGTQAGDPVEVGAITRAFGLEQDPDRALRIGSIKTNVGHLEGASGVAGVIKAIMMLENRIILPSRGFETLNPRIAFKKWNLRVSQAVFPSLDGININILRFHPPLSHGIRQDRTVCQSTALVMVVATLMSLSRMLWGISQSVVYSDGFEARSIPCKEDISWTETESFQILLGKGSS